jgi:hypothetical protein
MGNMLLWGKKGEKTLVCDLFTSKDVEDLYISPLPSTVLDVWRLKNVTRPRRQLLEVKDLDRKVVCLEDGERTVLIPMLHEVKRFW